MRIGAILGLMALGGCNTYGGGACKSLADDLCDVCPKNDYTKTYCKCVTERTLVQGDFTDGYQAVLGINDDTDAAMMCSTWLGDIDYPGPDGAASCKQDLEYLREWESQACDDLNWTSD